jgi:two-component system response regulator (stage 0 sporulation protein A)
MFSESNQIKVLVADDNREFCGILKSYFTNDPDFQLIDVCTNGFQSLQGIFKFYFFHLPPSPCFLPQPLIYRR